MAPTFTRRRALAGTAAVTAGALAGCFSSLSDDGDEGDRRAARVSLISDPADGNWDLYGGLTPYYTPVHETLTAATHDFESIEPWLATDWEAVDDQTWRFTLREDVTFHDGSPLDADAVATSLGTLFEHERYDWAKCDEDSFSAEDGDLIVEPFERFGALPGTLSHPLFGIQRRDDAEPERPVGTGPYETPAIEFGEPVHTVAFESYWGVPPQLEELTFEGVVDPNTRSLGLESAETDLAFDLPRSHYDSLAADDDVVVRTETEPRTGLAMVNLYRAPTDDEYVRRALNYAIDQETIVDTVLEGIGDPARGPYAESIPWSAHAELPAYGPDLERARDLLERSSYDADDLHLDLIVSNANPHEHDIASVMQSRFAEIGVEMDIRQLDSSSFFEVENKREANLILVELGSINGAADYLVHLQFHSMGGDNRALYESEGTGVSNPGPEVDELIERGDRALDETVKHDAYREVQHRVMDTGAVIPVYYKEYVLGQRATTTGPELHSVPHMTRWSEFGYRESAAGDGTPSEGER
ncbi:ABC transporter substrate-binding protein [Natronobiforma cellulositropha]|uniref:ABC transporter substrate-binding protein n=1 Tax=Natronobiforma cellulositropha TaxID=1679076 RepID=UPI0021D5D292|nr:ABC transporter substrate-binding protein [Natronobiforma cellulositropha]